MSRILRSNLIKLNQQKEDLVSEGMSVLENKEDSKSQNILMREGLAHPF